jgi:hypothetical protein
MAKMTINSRWNNSKFSNCRDAIPQSLDKITTLDDYWLLNTNIRYEVTNWLTPVGQGYNLLNLVRLKYLSFLKGFLIAVELILLVLKLLFKIAVIAHVIEYL